MANPDDTGVAPPPPPADDSILAELPEDLIAALEEALPFTVGTDYRYGTRESLISKLKFPTNTTGEVGTSGQVRYNPYDDAKYVGIPPDGQVSFFSVISEGSDIFAIDLNASARARASLESKYGNIMSLWTATAADPRTDSTHLETFNQYSGYIKSVYETSEETLWTAIENQLDTALKVTLDKSAIDASDGSVSRIGASESIFDDNAASEFEDTAATAAEAMVTSYFEVPSDGTAAAVKLKEPQKELVVSFLTEAYQIITLYQRQVFKDLALALTYGRSATWVTGLEDAKTARYNVYTTSDSSMNYGNDAVIAEAFKTIAACIGPLGWVNATELSLPHASPTLMDLIKGAIGADTTTGHVEMIKGTVAAKVVEAVQKTDYWVWYVELLNLYARLLLTMDGLSDDGTLDDTEKAAIAALEDAEAGNAAAASAAIIAAAPATGTTDSVPGGHSGSPKDEASETAKESAANIRTSIRDYLTINTPWFAAINEKKRQETYKQLEDQDPAATFRGIYPIEGRSESGVSQLMYNENQQALLDLTPAEISSLVPMIRIFKKGVSRGAEYEQELPFENNAINNMDSDKAIENNENMIIENYNKGNSVGIRSFEWDYQGTNPANDTKDITMTLTLYFQSFSDILRVRDLGAPTDDGPGTFSYADLITRPKKEQAASGDHRVNSHWNPEYYRIKFLVGHAYADPSAGAGDIIPTNKRIAIDTTVLPIIATLIDHRFDIQEDGSVNLIITYRGYLEAIAFSQGANIFSNSKLEETFKVARELFNNIMKECSVGRGDTLKADLTQQLDWFGKELQQEVFSSIISGLRKDDKIYSISPYVKDLIGRKILSTEKDLWPPTEPSAPRDIAEIIEAAGTAIKNCTADDKTKCVEDIFAKNINPVNIIADGRRPVPFFFVGDLIKSVKSVVEGSYYERQAGQGTSAQNAFVNTRLILTDIRMTQNPAQPDKQVEVNLADIPISVETFSVWFVKYITKYQGNRQFPEYSFGLFLSDFLRTVLNKFKSFADESGTSHSLTDASSIQRTQLFAPFDAVGECVRSQLTGKSGQKLTYDLFLPTGPCKSITRATQTLDADGDDGDGGDGDGGGAEDTVQVYAEKDAEKWINYFIYYPNIAGVKDGTASFPKPTQENLKMGYYQFNFGVNSGMVKKITFEKDDQPYVREARFFASETNYKTNRILQLREPYKITIETFGLPNIFPGSVCFIDSRTIDMALGKISDPASLAYMLGFGGYHMITHVKNSIRSGQFSTTLTAKWTSHGGAGDLNKSLRRSSNETEKKPECALFGANSADARESITEAFGLAGGAVNLKVPPGAPRGEGIVADTRRNHPDVTISAAFKLLLENKTMNIK